MPLIRFSQRAVPTATALLLTVLSSHANAASLLEVYDLAAQSDPTIRAAEASRLATREARPQAWSAFLPNISANAGWAGTRSGQDITVSPVTGKTIGAATTTR